MLAQLLTLLREKAPGAARTAGPHLGTAVPTGKRQGVEAARAAGEMAAGTNVATRAPRVGPRAAGAAGPGRGEA